MRKQYGQLIIKAVKAKAENGQPREALKYLIKQTNDTFIDFRSKALEIFTNTLLQKGLTEEQMNILFQEAKTQGVTEDLLSTSELAVTEHFYPVWSTLTSELMAKESNDARVEHFIKNIEALKAEDTVKLGDLIQITASYFDLTEAQIVVLQSAQAEAILGYEALEEAETADAPVEDASIIGRTEEAAE